MGQDSAPSQCMVLCHQLSWPRSLLHFLQELVKSKDGWPPIGLAVALLTGRPQQFKSLFSGAWTAWMCLMGEGGRNITMSVQLQTALPKLPPHLPHCYHLGKVGRLARLAPPRGCLGLLDIELALCDINSAFWNRQTDGLPADEIFQACQLHRQMKPPPSSCIHFEYISQ